MKGHEFGPCRSLGIERDGKLIAGVVLNNYTVRSINMSAAAEAGHWCSKTLFREVAKYVFITCRCARLSCTTSVNNQRAITCLEKLGFKREGILRDEYEDSDAAVYGLLKHECKWV